MQVKKYRDIAETYYPMTRLSLGKGKAHISDEQLENHLAELFPGASPEDVENFLRSLQRFGRQLAPVAQRALPGIIQGAAQGGAVAGPWGALAGALGGGAASLLSGGGRRPAARPQVGSPAPSPVRVSPTRSAVTSGVANMAPIQQLLALLARPETMQALSALLMSSSSSAGSANVMVGNRSVPAAAFANAISEFAAEVAECTNPSSAASISEYLIDESDNPRCDIANPSERAQVLLEDISLLSTRELIEEVLIEANDEEFEDEEEFFDDEEDDDNPLEEYEDALEGEEYL